MNNRLLRWSLLVCLALLLVACQPIRPLATARQPAATTNTYTDEHGFFTVESNGEVPFYARFGENETFSDGKHAVIVFYRLPECIPAEFNLNEFFHFPGESGPGALGCTPPTTTGIETWQNGPEVDPAPLMAEVAGRGAVPVWFVAAPELEAAMADGVVTIGELAALPSLLTGTADTYSELLYPSQTNAAPLIQFMATGALDDGSPLSLIHI